MPYIVSALYHFIDFKDESRCKAFVHALRIYMKENDVRGNFRVALEGYNGTISSPSRKKLNGFLDIVRKYVKDATDVSSSASSAAMLPSSSSLSSDCIYKESLHEMHVFRKATCKFKSEIVTIGSDCDAEVKKSNGSKGVYVEAKDWNDLIGRKNVLCIDVRNKYEVDMGTFEGATDPKTKTFQDFARFVETELLPMKTKELRKSTNVSPEGKVCGETDTATPRSSSSSSTPSPRNTEIAMFCTGGIRCEKATAYMKSKGFDRVYHLRGGILQYLRDVPQEKSKWKGECYVFDRRVSVDHDLKRGSYVQCFGCRAAISKAKTSTSKRFVEGVCCPRCYESRTAAGIRERTQRHEALTKRKTQNAPLFAPPEPAMSHKRS